MAVAFLGNTTMNQETFMWVDEFYARSCLQLPAGPGRDRR